MKASFLTVATGFALAIAVAACNKQAAGADSTKVAQSGASPDSAPTTSAPPIALPVTVEPARDGDLVLSIITSGQVRSERESQLKFEVGGTIQHVAVRP